MNTHPLTPHTGQQPATESSRKPSSLRRRFGGRILPATLLAVSLTACGGGDLTTTGPGSSVAGDADTAHSAGQTSASRDVGRSNLDDTTGAASSYTMHEYLTNVLRLVDDYWSGVWKDAGYKQPFVKYAFPRPGQSVADACGKHGRSDDDTAEYCPADDQIVISQDFAIRLWKGLVRANRDAGYGQDSGDFSVAFAVAHEYAHSLQAELNIIPDTAKEVANRRFPVYKTELHADCWAGVWANSAHDQGLLETGDIAEALDTASLLGDYKFNAADHHGTPAQRRAAFEEGYNSGTPKSCDNWLLDDYS